MNFSELLNYSRNIKDVKLFDTINVAVISNISLEPYFSPLLIKQFYDHSSIRVQVFFIPYEDYNSKEYEEALYNADLVVVWLNYELLFAGILGTDQQTINENLKISDILFRYIDKHSKAKILWLLYEDYYEQLPVSTGHTFLYNNIVNRMNQELYEKLNWDISWIDLKRILAEVGIASAYNFKWKYHWNAPYSESLIEIVVTEIHKQYLIEKGISKKCLVLDCDNVLWGGIISEDGIENIKLGNQGLGRVYQDFQRFVLSLYNHGVIIAVCSKNDLSDVINMFQNHSGMVLKEDHIACFSVNWENKPEDRKSVV